MPGTVPGMLVSVVSHAPYKGRGDSHSGTVESTGGAWSAETGLGSSRNRRALTTWATERCVAAASVCRRFISSVWSSTTSRSQRGWRTRRRPTTSIITRYERLANVYCRSARSRTRHTASVARPSRRHASLRPCTASAAARTAAIATVSRADCGTRVTARFTASRR